MIILQAVVLGIVQGMTEFIPVSSSAHLVIVPWLFGWTDPALASLPFDLALHMGTLAALLAFFAGDWVRLIRAGIASVIERRIGADTDRRLAWLLLIGCIPGAVVGLLAEARIEKLFHEPGAPIRASAMVAMGIIIALLAAAMLAADRLAKRRRGMETLSVRDAIAVGLAQALSIFPGVSRSGSTITAGLAIGLEREAAARFSFLLAAPIILGAGCKSLLDIRGAIGGGALAGHGPVLFATGTISAAISGYLCIRLLLRFLQTHSAAVFAYYRWVLAALVIVVALLRG